MIKILAACGAGVNSSHQIKSALEEELSNRGYDVGVFVCVFIFI
ncbi:PTS system galactose-specific transporter subunit IIB [Streptococcus pneumoniae]|nr:PTS system galactose-specific transporter subunit IIB [Streptococcus pneumoniae]